MGQITHPTLGSPMALVTPWGQLVTAGSQTASNSDIMENTKWIGPNAE